MKNGLICKKDKHDGSLPLNRCTCRYGVFHGQNNHVFEKKKKKWRKNLGRQALPVTLIHGKSDAAQRSIFSLRFLLLSDDGLLVVGPR